MFVSLLEAAEARGLNLGGLGAHGKENKRNSNFESARISPEAVLFSVFILCFHTEGFMYSLSHSFFFMIIIPHQLQRPVFGREQ